MEKTTIRKKTNSIKLSTCSQQNTCCDLGIYYSDINMKSVYILYLIMFIRVFLSNVQDIVKRTALKLEYFDVVNITFFNLLIFRCCLPITRIIH